MVVAFSDEPGKSCSSVNTQFRSRLACDELSRVEAAPTLCGLLVGAAFSRDVLHHHWCYPAQKEFPTETDI